MAYQFTVGIQFNLDPGWMGGAYYLQNMLNALGTLDDARQPQVVVVTHLKSSYDFLQESGYPKLSYRTQEQVAADPHHCGIDLLFPFPMEGLPIPTLTWIPDFQEKHMPYLFTPDEIAGRRKEHESYFAREGLLLSSESALDDFHHFYGDYKIPVFVVPFASFLSDELPDVLDVRARHELPENYFFAPNQFWVHKNHVVILAALRELKQRGVAPVVCFSGKEFDFRAQGYAPFLRQKISEWGLEDQVNFLGFMPREDQIVAMKNAQAIVQPSRFEGWSTVIEDAKALNKFVIASNLSVHAEQLSENADFFEPSDFSTLADLLEQHWQTSPAVKPLDYKRNQREYGERLAGVFRALVMANQTMRLNAPREIRSEISHSIDDRDLLGLSALTEEPNSALGIDGKSRWMTGSELTISADVLKHSAPVLKIRFRNGIKEQELSIKVGEKIVQDRFQIEEDDLATPLELLINLADHVGLGDVKVQVSKLKEIDYRNCGLLIEQIDFLVLSKD